MTRPLAIPLIAALVSGEPGSFAEVYDRLGPSLLRVAAMMLKSTTAAEDAVQDVFVQIVRHRDRLPQVEDLDAYVFAMLRHTVSRHLNRQHTEQKYLREWASTQTEEKSVDPTDNLEAALRALPAEQREVIALKIDGGLTFKQIGEILNVSQNTAASRYRYAIDKLRHSLE